MTDQSPEDNSALDVLTSLFFMWGFTTVLNYLFFIAIKGHIPVYTKG